MDLIIPLATVNGMETIWKFQFYIRREQSSLLKLHWMATKSTNGIEARALTIKREIDKVFKPYGYVTIR